MRVLFDHQIFGHHSYSGISRYLFEIASGMAVNHGHDVSVVAPLYVNGYLRHSPAQLRVVGVPVPEFRRSARLYRSINSLLAGPLMTALKPQIVHETYYSRHRLAPSSARIVVTVHDMVHERLPHLFSPTDPTPMDKAAAVARADHVICISENTRRDLIDLLDVAPEKTSVVRHGFSLVEAPEDASADLNSRRPFLLYVSYRGSHKNFMALMRAYAASKMLSTEFDIVCFGGGPLGADERMAIEALGISGERVSQVSGDDKVLASLYRQAAALVYPSLYEGFGIPPLEAMSFGCPVACSNTSSLPEVVGDAAVMFDPDDLDEMRTAVERVATEGSLRQTLVERGQARIKQFSWRRCAEETLFAYRQALQ